ncbi:hypothetical protein ABPG72_010302 [Tetrahymena utriculariae]
MISKPWEKRRQVDSNLTAAIQSNATNLPPVPAADQLATDPSSALVPTSNALGTESSQLAASSAANGLNSSLGTSSMGTMGGYGMGSSYGGMGSSYGGYGSSMYGGYGSSMYGGYGSSMYGGFGSSMYGGGYGRYGMGMGMGMDPNQQGFMQNSMMFLNSFGFVIQAMGEIARTVEMNAQGLVHLFQSMFNLGLRVKGWGINFFQFMKRMFKKVYEKVVEFVQQKGRFLFMGNSNNNVKMRMRLVSTAIRIVLVMFIVSMIPLVKNMLKQDQNEILFNSIKNQM